MPRSKSSCDSLSSGNAAKRCLAEAPCRGRSKWKGDKQVKTKKNIYPGMVEKKKDRRVPLLRRRRFLYTIQLLLHRVVPLALAPLSSEHRKRVPKYAPSRPTSTPSTLPTSPRRSPPEPKMKIGWCLREIRGGRARVGGGRRSSKSRELSATCIVCMCACARMYVCANMPLVDYHRTAILTLVILALMYVRCLKLLRNKMDGDFFLVYLTIEVLQPLNLWNNIYKD